MKSTNHYTLPHLADEISTPCLSVNICNAYILHIDTTQYACFHPPFCQKKKASAENHAHLVTNKHDHLVFTHHLPLTCRFTQQILYLLGPLIGAATRFFKIVPSDQAFQIQPTVLNAQA